jgi:hypothetical protein
MPAGLAEPLHVHSREFRVVVIAGTLRYTIAGRDTVGLGAGSYVAIPAGIPHLAACVGPEPCEVYVEQDGALDVQPVAVPLQSSGRSKSSGASNERGVEGEPRDHDVDRSVTSGCTRACTGTR